MVTGDNVETAKAIALECGILDTDDVASEPIVIEGKVFREMSETAREEIADKITVSKPISLPPPPHPKKNIYVRNRNCHYYSNTIISLTRLKDHVRRYIYYV